MLNDLVAEVKALTQAFADKGVEFAADVLKMGACSSRTRSR